MKLPSSDAVRSTRRFLIFVCVYGWSVTVFAAAMIGPDLVGLPWAQIGVGIAISLWGGLTRTAERAMAAKQAGREFHALREALRDGMAAVLVGGVTYLAGAWHGSNIYVLGVALGLGGYVVTPILPRLGEIWASRVRKAFGDNDDPPPPPSRTYDRGI
jgi:hypothetical protein